MNFKIKNNNLRRIKMSIFSRMSDIISANLNDMVEGMENPEKMLRQAVREMDSTIEQAREGTAKTIANQTVIQNELKKNQQQVKIWSGRSTTAISDDNDELARKCIARKQEHEKLVVALEDELSESSLTIKKLRNQLQAMEAKHAEAKRRLATLSARKRVADLRAKVTDASTLQSPDNAFSKFDKMREKVEMAEAQADAMRQLRNPSDDDCDIMLDDQKGFDNLEVEAELAELKKKKSGL
jgi:phage shock protein A